jgi:hypothetical protein
VLEHSPPPNNDEGLVIVDVFGYAPPLRFLFHRGLDAKLLKANISKVFKANRSMNLGDLILQRQSDGAIFVDSDLVLSGPYKLVPLFEGSFDTDSAKFFASGRMMLSSVLNKYITPKNILAFFFASTLIVVLIVGINAYFGVLGHMVVALFAHKSEIPECSLKTVNFNIIGIESKSRGWVKGILDGLLGLVKSFSIED